MRPTAQEMRLSAGGRQPMHLACGRYALISNGEIYNFRALRRELECARCVFRSCCDTEVMLAAIAKWRLKGAMFDGMFAFALWDRRDRVLHLGRDRLGESRSTIDWSGGSRSTRFDGGASAASTTRVSYEPLWPTAESTHFFSQVDAAA
jgi:hypothetical protein